LMFELLPRLKKRKIRL